VGDGDGPAVAVQAVGQHVGAVRVLPLDDDDSELHAVRAGVLGGGARDAADVADVQLAAVVASPLVRRLGEDVLG
jgi:hypothetical protein